MPNNKDKNNVKKLVNIVNSVDDNTIMLYGYIGRYEDIDWKPFQEVFRKLDYQGNVVTLLFNCMGGGTFEALAIYDLIRNSKCKVIGIVEGIAASSGALLFEACDERKMTSNSRLMVHRVSGGVCGEEEDIRSYADLMKSENERLVKILTERSGKDDATVNEWLKHGSDTWFSAKEAISNNLCDSEVVSEKATTNKLGTKPPKNEADTWKMFSNILISNQIENQNMKNLQAAVVLMLMNAGYKVTHESPENELTAALSEFNQKTATKLANVSVLENQLSAVNSSRAKVLIDNAVAAGKLTNLDDAKKQSWVDKATKEFDMVNELLGMTPASTTTQTPGLPNINNHLNTKGADTIENKDDRKTWNMEKWEKEDPAGLANMLRNDIAQYKSLFKAQYNMDFPG
jgi:ATP-dependent Clp protease, protease subunit